MATPTSNSDEGFETVTNRRDNGRKRPRDAEDGELGEVRESGLLSYLCFFLYWYLFRCKLTIIFDFTKIPLGNFVLSTKMVSRNWSVND